MQQQYVIAQRFDLVVESIPPQGPSEKTPLEELCEIYNELSKKGYRMFESTNCIQGLPTSIIVLGDLHMQHKTDFYEATRQHKIVCYRSDESYMMRPVKRRSKVSQ